MAAPPSNLILVPDLNVRPCTSILGFPEITSTFPTQLSMARCNIAVSLARPSAFTPNVCAATSAAAVLSARTFAHETERSPKAANFSASRRLRDIRG